MKKFYALLLALDLLAIGTSATVFAHGDDNYNDVVSSNELTEFNAPIMIDEEQLVAVFNIALKNPKILKQLEEQVALVRQMPSTERGVYETMMMTAQLKLIEEMNKKLNPAKKEESYLQEILSGAIKTAKGATKTVASQALGWGIVLVGGTLFIRHSPELIAKIIPVWLGYMSCGRTWADILLGYPCPV